MIVPSDFDWSSDENVVVKSRQAVAVYENPFGKIVIRAEKPWDEDADEIIYIEREDAEAVARAIIQAAGVGGALALPMPEPKDRTAAERQRRRRDKGRDGHGDERDNDRDEPPSEQLGLIGGGS